MTVKNVVVELEVEYLQKAAKERGVSRAKLVRLLMKKVIAEELVSDMLGDGNLADAESPSKRYRRFRKRENPRAVIKRRESKRPSSLGRLTSPSDSKLGFNQTGRNNR